LAKPGSYSRRCFNSLRMTSVMSKWVWVIRDEGFAPRSNRCEHDAASCKPKLRYHAAPTPRVFSTPTRNSSCLSIQKAQRYECLDIECRIHTWPLTTPMAPSSSSCVRSSIWVKSKYLRSTPLCAHLLILWALMPEHEFQKSRLFPRCSTYSISSCEGTMEAETVEQSS
jgi:hypothetical protein